MFDWSWIATSGTAVLMIVITGIGIYVALLLSTRIAGLRSFSKMSSFDFAITVAIGSVVASTVVAKTPSMINGAIALFVLYTLQYTVAKLRRLFEPVEKAIDNQPMLLMIRDKILDDNLDTVRLTVDDLRYKLRLAGITNPKKVLAVIFETTGDVSVLQDGDELDPWIIENVKDWELITAVLPANNVTNK